MGLVTTQAGTPLPGAVLTLVSTEGQQVDQTISADDGSYQALAPSSGNYLLICRALTSDREPEASWISIQDEPTHHNITLNSTTTDLHR